MAWLRAATAILLLLLAPHPAQARRPDRPQQRVVLGADHAGMALKGRLARTLRRWGWQTVDANRSSEIRAKSVDYPDVAGRVARQVARGDARFGVLVCGTGIGMSIAANKVVGVRAAVCQDASGATMARAHNDANVLCLGARVTDPSSAQGALRAFVNQRFEGGRHLRRVNKISRLEQSSQSLRRMAGPLGRAP